MSIASGLIVTCLLWGQTPSPRPVTWGIPTAPQPIGPAPLFQSSLPAEMTAEQLQSLRSAIEDLQAAGLKELAQNLQRQMQSRTTDLEKSLKAKQEQIARLQAEAQAIEDLLRPQIQVQFQLQIWEMDHAQLLKEATEECLALHKILTQKSPTERESTLRFSSKFYELALHAKAHHAIKILSTPRVITLQGQEALVLMGQHVPIGVGWPYPVQVGFENLGTSIKVVPSVSRPDEVTCNWVMEFSSINPPSEVTPAGYGLIAPEINRQRLEVTTRNHNGEFFVVGQPLPAGEGKSIVVFATVELPKPQPEPSREPSPRKIDRDLE
ncbi:hypothetical protein GC163_07945 [bacterium]|nr:hypothetical protein [bacterium]